MAHANQRRQLVTAVVMIMNVYLCTVNVTNADMMDKFLMAVDVMDIANVRVGCVRDGVYLIVVVVRQNILMALVVGKILTVSQITAIVGNVELEEGFPILADALIMTSAQVESVLDGISLEGVVLVKLKVLMVLAVVGILTVNLAIVHVVKYVEHLDRFHLEVAVQKITNVLVKSVTNLVHKINMINVGPVWVKKKTVFNAKRIRTVFQAFVNATKFVEHRAN